MNSIKLIMINEIKYNIRSVPKFTRYYIIGIIFTSIWLTIAPFILKTYGLIYIMLDFNKIVYNFQYWRLITNFFIVNRIGISLIFEIFLIYTTFTNLEKQSIKNKKYDSFLMMIVYLSLFCIISNLLSGNYYLSNEFIMSLVYVDCQSNTDQIRSVWGLHIKCKINLY